MGGFNIVEKLLNITLLGTAWVLWLLVLASILSVAIILERSVFFYRTRLNFEVFLNAFSEALIKHDWLEVRKLCENGSSFETETILKGLSLQEKGPRAMEQAMSAYVVGRRQSLDRGLIVLGTLGNNAPFIGLFGTVLGIIMAFNDLALTPEGGPSVVMAGISESLVATAVGLLVAIPAVIAFNAFQRIIKRRVANAEAAMKILLSQSEA